MAAQTHAAALLSPWWFVFVLFVFPSVSFVTANTLIYDRFDLIRIGTFYDNDFPRPSERRGEGSATSTSHRDEPPFEVPAFFFEQQQQKEAGGRLDVVPRTTSEEEAAVCARRRISPRIKDGC
ncbi:hypothetical protein JOB18_029923 [Solea senegalensis]|uniref:Uncharacterized protein n=1 Tax=Solea senegalensis TaxID=28829 RepID=A0AAV6Q319_SOLSE|nr:hypothetical protein JOB18_029923 [Solea senegalensis]